MLTASQSLKLYEAAHRYFPKEEVAKMLTVEIITIIEGRSVSKKEHLLTKKDLIELGARLENSIAQSKTDMIKWMFSFFVALALMIIGLYLKK